MPFKGSRCPKCKSHSFRMERKRIGGEATYCRCLKCGHDWVSRSWRTRQALQRQIDKEARRVSP